MKYPVIDGREVVPVRLIPFIASNSWLGRETIAGILANKVRVSGWPYPSDHEQFEVMIYDEVTGCRELTTTTRAKLIGPKQRDNRVNAYHLNDEGVPVKMWPSEWEVIYREVSVLEPRLRKKEEKNGVPGSKESAWMLKTIKALPSGVFLWRDDFDSLWKAHISTFSLNTSYDPPHFRKLNHDAYIRPKYSELIWEGFEHLRQADDKACEPLPTLLPDVVSGAPSSRPTNKNLLRVIVEQTANSLYLKFNKFPSYRLVLKELNKSAINDDQIGAIIEKADLSGVFLIEGTSMSVKTIQNWLTDYKKTVPAFRNQSPVLS